MTSERIVAVGRRVRWLWRNSHPDMVEALTALLSLWYAAALAQPYARSGPAWRYSFALVALAAGVLKLWGVVAERQGLRLAGLALGAGFWLVLAAVFALSVKGGITWGGFCILAAAQCWAFWRVRRP